MGCSVSKVENEEVVLMCKERKRYIKQAVDQRYVLAAAHVEYIQALSSIGNALRHFAEREMQLLSSVPASPKLSPSEQKNSEPVTELEKSPSSSPLHSHSHSHSHSASPPAESPSYSPPHETSESPPLYASPSRMDYLRSVNMPSTSYEERPFSPERGTRDDSYSNASQYGMGSFFGISWSPPPPAPAPTATSSYSPGHPPPPPSPPRTFAWDFFNPFISTDNLYQHYSQSRLSPASDGDSRDSKQVREEEGIPDLEDEDQEDGKKKVQGEKRTAESVSRDSSKSHSKSAIGSPDPMVESSTRSVAHPTPDESVEKVSTKDTGDGDRAKVGGNFEDLPVDKAVMENTAISGGNDIDFSVTYGERNVLEVIKDIEEQFKRAHDSGKELSQMLETNNVPYQPRFNSLKALFARALNAITGHRAMSSRPPLSKRPRSSHPKDQIDDKYNHFTEEFGKISGIHSSTLDSLYAWEKKLYEEVKAGERIRIAYEKKCMQLKNQDAKGEDPQKVDATRAAIKNLQTRIKICIQVVDSVSKRIHKLRDEELQPQVAELIQGLMKMWKLMLECHDTQKQIISQAKSLGRFAAAGIASELHREATMKLENELRHWRTSFSNWISAQKAYVQALNGWLLKCLLEVHEDTPDGRVPFSPRRVGAPPVCIICNDWCHALETLPEDPVITAIGSFAENVRGVWEHQEEEQRQKKRAENLAKDLERRVVLLQRVENRMHETQISVDKKPELDSGQAAISLANQKMSIDSFRKQVEEESKKHHEVMQQTRNITLSSLQTGLKLVFEAMTQFTAASLKTYEELSINYERERVPRENGEISYIEDS